MGIVDETEILAHLQSKFKHKREENHPNFSWPPQVIRDFKNA
jgi:hypothetical protein